MNSVKLAPLIGLTADEHVELESLSSLIGTYPFTNSQVHNSTNHTRQFKPIRERSIFTISEAPNTKISETVDANTNKRSGSFKKNKRYRRNRSSPLSIADVNNLWGVYLRQQEELGGKHFLGWFHKLCVLKCRQFLKIVNISDKQAMAKKYHELGRKEVKILKHLSGKTESDEDIIIEFPRKKKIKVVPGRFMIKKNNHILRCVTEKVKNVAAARPDKPTNKRQKRKKMIREELKRQLSMGHDNKALVYH